MGDFDGSFSLSSLMCQEDEEPFLVPETGDSVKDCVDYKYCVLGNDDKEYEKYVEKLLLDKITNFGSKSCVFSDDYSRRSQSWLECARLDAVEWILNARAMFGFQFHTAYLSVDYFDRFLSKRSIADGKLWAIRLLSVACLSLAAKMEERNVPSLSEFKLENFDFESKVIQRMELLVLNTLEWKMGSTTPFVFLRYFISKFCGECRPKNLFSKAVELVMKITKEINLMDREPSMIAAAAVLVASECELTKETMELKLNVISSWGSPEIEGIYSCYILMKKILMAKLKTPKSVVCQNFSATSSKTVLGNSSFTSGAATKRRLTYNESAENSPPKKTCRP